jgi:hypothetical protein
VPIAPEDSQDLWTSFRGAPQDGTPYQRVPAKHQNVLAARLPPTTIFHFLYRMRTRSNYHDADAFIVGSSAGDDALTFNAGIVNLLRATPFVFESAISRSLARPAFERIATRFVTDVGHVAEQSVGRRVACQ